MGNIEIREQSNPKRRTHIFADRNHSDLSPLSFRDSLTQRFEYNRAYSPIRYSNKSNNQRYTPLTQRKVNTDRLKQFEAQKNINYLPLHQQVNNKKNSALKLTTSHITNIKSFKNQNFPQHQNQQQEQQVSSFNFSGKIVSNSRRVKDERKDVQSTIPTQSRQIYRERQGRVQDSLENRDIIKKVRNFNDFLNQIKRKLKEDKQQNLFRNKYQPQNYKRPVSNIQMPQNIPHYSGMKKQDMSERAEDQKGFEKTKSIRKIQVALKLQNQKLQLEKYRKLVERQLSKTHSIENISLCTRNSGQKILTIQYQSMLPYNILSIDNSKASLAHELSEKYLKPKPHTTNPNFLKIDKKQKINNNDLQDQIQSKEQQKQIQQQNIGQINQKEKQRQMLRKLKSQYEKIRKNMTQLGGLIENYQNSIEKFDNKKSQQKILIEQASFIDQFSRVSSLKKNPNLPYLSENLRASTKDKVIIKDEAESDSGIKIQRIEGLFERLYDLQHEYQSTDRQIREAIQNSHSDSNVDESLRQNFSSFAPNKNQ